MPTIRFRLSSGHAIAWSKAAKGTYTPFHRTLTPRKTAALEAGTVPVALDYVLLERRSVEEYAVATAG